jgi:hypothetical protein
VSLAIQAQPVNYNATINKSHTIFFYSVYNNNTIIYINNVSICDQILDFDVKSDSIFILCDNIFRVFKLSTNLSNFVFNQTEPEYQKIILD